MSEKHDNNLNPLDPIENYLVELKSAEQANLFNQTKVDTHELLRTTTQITPIWRRLPVGLVTSAAASIILAFGIGGYMFYSEIDSLRQQKASRQYAVQTNVDQSDCDGSFFECVTGPSQIVMANCIRFDYDLDGHIDLFDMKTYQLNCDGITQ